MKRQQFIDTVAQNLELAGLAPDNGGVYSIVFDGDLEIEIYPVSETRLLLRSRLAAAPEEPAERESFLRDVLQRNMANLHSQQGALTVDAASGRLWLYRPIDLTSLDGPGVAPLIEDFVNLADWWGQSGRSSSPAAAPLPFQMMRP